MLSVRWCPLLCVFPGTGQDKRINMQGILGITATHSRHTRVGGPNRTKPIMRILDLMMMTMMMRPPFGP